MLGEAKSSTKRAGDKASIIYEQLRSDILTGIYAPGAPLSQLAIAELFGTSRGPVREALRRLQQDKLVLARANQRFNVAPFDIPDLESILSLHLANVTLAIRASVPHLSADDLEQLRQQVDRMESAADKGGSEWEQAYRDFVLTLTKSCGARMQGLISHLIDLIEFHRRKTLDKVPMVHVTGGEFRSVLDAILARNGELAAERYADFASRLSMLILVGVSPHYDASILRSYVLSLSPPSTRK